MPLVPSKSNHFNMITLLQFVKLNTSKVSGPENVSNKLFKIIAPITICIIMYDF